MSKGKVKRDAKKIKSAIQSGGGLYFPGPIHVVEALTKKHHIRTIPENGNDREPIYCFNGQIHERAEELIKQEAHLEYIRQWKVMKAISASKDKELTIRLESTLNRGPSANDINEVLSMIRRTTFSRDKMNPTSHIPFKNGLLNLRTRKLEPFTPELFYTYQIDANLLNRYVTLKDSPKFSYLLNTAFYQRDVPMVLAYSAYSFHPDLPQHKVLFVLGRQRIGKGTLARVLQRLMPKGAGSISLARLLTSDRFMFTGIEEKNLLIDSETKRKFRRGTVLEWSAFCNLFGKDVLSVEPKGHEAHDYVSRAKGIFLGNLPFIPVDSPPAITRILLVVTRDEPPKKVIPDLDEKILESERDIIATLLMQILFKLIDRDFIFPGQLSDDETAQLLDKLADPVENFIEEETEYDKDSTVPVDDAYLRFQEWCKRKGIPAIARQTFVKKFSHTYPKRRSGPRGNRVYVFSGCYLYEAEIKIEDQVGHGSGYGETLKLTGFANEVTRVQHECCILRVTREEDDHDYNIKYNVHKLDTPLNTPGNRVIKDLANIKGVSNLYQKKVFNDSTKNNDNTFRPAKSDVQNEDHTITEEQGNGIIEQLLKDGTFVNPRDSGPSIDRQSFKIAIPMPRDPEKLALLKDRMSSLGFKEANSGAYGTLFFVRPLGSEVQP